MIVPSRPGVIFLILILVLLAFSIALYISSSSLSLPFAGTALAAVLLPIFSAANALSRPRLLHGASQPAAPAAQRLLPTVLESCQAVLATALATLLLQHALPGPARSCGLAVAWQRLFSAKDAHAIRRVQDALGCCGLNSVHDRAWPFPESGLGPGACAKRFDRHTPCAAPWSREAERHAGLGLGIVLSVAALQIITLLVARPAKQWRRSWWAQQWPRSSPEPRNLIEEGERVRPLLDAPDAEDEAEDAVAYRDLSPTRVTPPTYGTAGNGNGPRVEPSGLDRNAWSTD